MMHRFLPLEPSFDESSEFAHVTTRVQVSIFKCGGIAIGSCVSHKVVDGTGLYKFLKGWANMTCGDKEVVYPNLSAPSLFPAKSLWLNDMSMAVSKLLLKEGKCVTKRFVFRSDALATLKNEVAREGVPQPSRVEVVSALIWKSAMEASQEAYGGLEKPSLITHAVNLRRKLATPMSQDIIGNMIWFAGAVISPPSNEKTLHDLVRTLRESFMKISVEFVRKAQGDEGHVEMQKSLEEIWEIDSKGMDINSYNFTSWCKMGFYEIDFGWEKPIWLAGVVDEGAPYDDDVEPESGEGLVARGRSSDRGKRNNEKRLEKAAEVAIAKGESDGDVYLAIDTEISRDELIVDSGCTFYMILHRSGLPLKMHDSVFRTIMGVRHVLDLKRNLISLSTLEANGCKYSGEGGVMKIFKGALVLIKAIQSGGLYVLQGIVVYGSAGVATSKASLDDSKLWHYHLGHMGKKGMKNLSNKGLIKVSCNLEFCEQCVFGNRKGLGFFLNHKDEVFPIFKEWKLLIENQTGKKIKKLRTDNGLEFCRESFNALCRKYGIARHHTLVRTPQQNDVAERMNRTIMEKVRCNSVDYYNLRVFECLIYVHVNEGKLVPHAVKGIFLGYGSGVKGYRVWFPDPKYRKIIHSRDVTFNEDVIINSGKDFVPPHNFDNNHTKGKVEFEFHIENSTHTQPLYNDEHIETQDDGNMPTSIQSQPQTEYLLARDRERRQVNRLPRLEDYQCDLEVESLHKNETWELMKLLEEKRVISCKWLFKVKNGIPGVKINRYKARYVVCGFDQGEGIDVNEVFFLVVRHTSIRVLLSIVALQDLELEQLDVKTAFLHSHLEEEIYVEQPEGFKVPGKEDHVCRLKKSLYGLKQNPRQ
nr:vinorine synthase-like [Tanacetum cinerariifolium]